MIGEYIKNKRQKLCLTQKQLASKVRVSQSYINLIETNKRKINYKKIEDFAKVLNVSKTEIEKNNEILVIKKEDEKVLKAKKRINKQKLELDLLIQNTEETLIFLKKARENLETISEE